MAKRRSRGEGTIYQRKDGLWSAQVTLPNGKRKTKYAKTQKEAREWLAGQNNQIRAGIWTSSDSIQLEAFMARYIDEVAPSQVRAETLKNYHWATRHIYPTLGKTKLSALRPEQIQRLYNAKIDEGLAPGSVLIVHSVLHKVLQQAEEWGVVSRNVASLAHPPRQRAAESTLLTRLQLEQLMETCRGRWLYPLVHLAIATGLRRGELIGLKWSDVDWDGKMLTVSRIVSIDFNNQPVITEPKTSRSRRLVTLPADTVKVLSDWHAEIGGDFIFPTRDGQPKHPGNVNDSWKLLLRKAKLPHVKFHSLRHLHATLLLEAGVSAKVVSERLGHTSIGITLDIYSHVTAPLQQHAADTIGQAMNGLHKQ